MARYRAIIEGSRGPASRLGSANSGMFAEINGWDIGVRVYMEPDGDKDIVTVVLTRGSNNSETVINLAEAECDKDGTIRIRKPNGTMELGRDGGWSSNCVTD